MASIPRDLLYAETHEWLRVEGSLGTVGITDHAQKALGDLTFVELPKLGRDIQQGEEACALESCKAAASLYAPASGTVAEANSALADDPGAINADCYGRGWILKIELAPGTNLSNLKNADQYDRFLAAEAAK